MRAVAAGVVVLAVALIATTTTARADDDRGLHVVSVDASDALAPSIVVEVPGLLAGQALSQAAFAAVDDNGARPIHVEHLGLGQLDAALVLDTAVDVSLESVTQQQAAAVELLRLLDGARELGVYTSTARSLQPPTPDHPANYSFVGDVRPEGDRHFAAGLLSALAHFRRDPGSRRALIVMSAGAGDWTTPAETTVLAEGMAAHGVQVFWLAMDGTAPPIVDDLAAAGQPVSLVQGMTAAAAADHVATALRAQYRMTIDLTGASGPVRLRLEADGAVHEIPLAMEAAAEVPPAAAPPSTPSAAAPPPPSVPATTSPPVTTSPRTRAAGPIEAAKKPEPLERAFGVIEIGGGTSATWWALTIFVTIAAAATLTVVVASTSTAVVRRTERIERT
jgi:hypothetical protein